jgi:hypothetical protein
LKTELVELEPVLQTEYVESDIEPGEDFEYQDNIDQQCQILQLLLNQKMTSFHFPLGLMYADHQCAISDLWHSLLREKPPNLTTIAIESCYLDEWGTDWDIKAFATSMLPVFPKLEELRLDYFECDDVDLIKIAQHLPRLRYLFLSLEIKSQ